mmetsp:Transcript_17333/g.37989  ORF Transcript_17333/g.37989 Transcript_17333/m.37989 type:complete len:200 (-) Transcript_17333:1207-1806(-)
MFLHFLNELLLKLSPFLFIFQMLFVFRFHFLQIILETRCICGNLLHTIINRSQFCIELGDLLSMIIFLLERPRQFCLHLFQVPPFLIGIHQAEIRLLLIHLIAFQGNAQGFTYPTFRSIREFPKVFYFTLDVLHECFGFVTLVLAVAKNRIQLTDALVEFIQIFSETLVLQNITNRTLDNILPFFVLGLGNFGPLVNLD